MSHKACPMTSRRSSEGAGGAGGHCYIGQHSNQFGPGAGPQQSSRLSPWRMSSGARRPSPHPPAGPRASQTLRTLLQVGQQIYLCRPREFSSPCTTAGRARGDSELCARAARSARSRSVWALEAVYTHHDPTLLLAAAGSKLTAFPFRPWCSGSQATASGHHVCISKETQWCNGRTIT